MAVIIQKAICKGAEIMPDNQELSTQEQREQDASTPPEEATWGEDAPAATANDETPQLYGALKGYFFTPKRGEIWGAFCFLFNGTTGGAMENVFWVTRQLLGPPLDVNRGWRELNKAISSMGIYEKNLGDKLINIMLETFSTSARMALSRDPDPASRLASLSEEVRNNFERVAHYFLEFEMAFEPLSRQDLTTAGVLPQGEESPSDASKSPEEEKSFAGTLITCLPVIDPAHGAPVSELVPGDVLEVKMQGGVGAGDMIQKYLTATNQDAAFPVLSVNKKNDEKTYIFLDINDEVQGLITVTKDLRLRRLERGTSSHKTMTVNLDNLIFFGTLAVAAIAILLVIRFLIF
jgi:hypothetical protein